MAGSKDHRLFEGSQISVSRALSYVVVELPDSSLTIRMTKMPSLTVHLMRVFRKFREVPTLAGK